MPENKETDFYNRERRYNVNVSKIDEWCTVHENKKLIDRYLQYAKAKPHWYATRIKFLYFLKHISKWLPKRWNKCQIPDFIALGGKINDYNIYHDSRGKRRGFNNKSKKECWDKWKRFCDISLYDERKDLVDWLYDRRNDLFRTGNLDDKEEKIRIKINKDQIAEMIKVAEVRMKAFISVYFEGCLRPSEGLLCKISHLEPIKEGFKLKIPISKSKHRSVLLFESAHYLSTWMEQHPNKSPGAYLFCTNANANKGNRWSVAGSSKQLRKISYKAMNKKISLYDLRRGGFTYKSSVLKMSNSTMEQIMGWSKGAYSKRAKHYDVNIEADAHNETMQAYGKAPEASLKEQPVVCLRCKTVHHIANAEDYCNKCSFPLKPETVAKMEQKQMVIEEIWKKIASEFIDYDKLKSDKDTLNMLRTLNKE